MNYPNALTGVKRIFKAEIIALAAEIIAVIIGASHKVSLSFSYADSPPAWTIVLSALFLCSLILLIVSYFINLSGIRRAAKDEAQFRSALIFILLGLAAYVAGAVFQFLHNELIYNLCNSAADVFGLCSTICIVHAIINLAEELKRDDIGSKGGRIIIVIMLMYALSTISELIVYIFSSSAVSEIIHGVMSAVAGILSIVQFFLYLSYLKKAEKMLAE